MAASQPSQGAPARTAFFCTFSARHSAGRLRATASSTSAWVDWCFSFFFSSSQLDKTSPVEPTLTSPNTWGWR